MIDKDSLRVSTFTTVKSMIESVASYEIIAEFPYNDKKYGKSKFPLVVTSLASVALKDRTFNNGKLIKEVTMPIEIYSINKSLIDTFLDDLEKYFYANGRTNGLKNIQINDSDLGAIQSNGFNVSFKMLSLVFDV